MPRFYRKCGLSPFHPIPLCSIDNVFPLIVNELNNEENNNAHFQESQVSTFSNPSFFFLQEKSFVFIPSIIKCLRLS